MCLLRVLAPPQRFGVTILSVMFGDDMRQAAIASSSDTFSSVWKSADGYAYGVTFNEIVN